MAQVRLQPMEDGTYTVIVRKTRANENQSRLRSGIARENLAAEIAKLVGEVKGGLQQQGVLLSV